MSVNVSYKDTVHSYGVSEMMLIENLKEEISEKQYLYQFKLMLGQAELLDKRPVIKYLFTTFTLCYDDKEAAVEINHFNLNVTVINPEDQKEFTEKATPEMTVGQLKQILSRKLSSTQGKWTLKKDGKEVPDEDLLETHLVAKSFNVLLEDMTVIVNNERRVYSIKTRCDMTIQEFRTLCCDKIGPSFDEFNLMFDGEILEQFIELDLVTLLACSLMGVDPRVIIHGVQEKNKTIMSRTLGSYRIQNNSIILTISNVKGGQTDFIP